MELYSAPEGPRLRVEVEVLHDGGVGRSEAEEALWRVPSTVGSQAAGLGG